MALLFAGSSLAQCCGVSKSRRSFQCGWHDRPGKSPVVQDGKVYMATSDTALFHVLDAHTGASIYSLKFQWPIFGSPAIAGKMLYLAGQDGKLSAVDLSNRKVAWSFQSDASLQNLQEHSKADGSPNYSAAFRSSFYDDMLVGISKMHAVGTILSSPVVSGNVVYVGSADGNLYALE
ncbi:MAG: PQQ-binding-like beta-propeller repeat protein [Acidobacteriaceae bacterium]